MCGSSEGSALTAFARQPVGRLGAGLAALHLLATPAAAAPVTAVPTAPTRATVAAALPAQAGQALRVDGHRWRCWQHGRLIIDEFRPGPLPDATERPDSLLRLPGDGTAAGWLLDARHATCLVKPQSRPALNMPPAAGVPAMPSSPNMPTAQP
jgi:hypothetical protein